MKRLHKDSKKFLTKEQMIEKFGSIMAQEEWDKSQEIPSFSDFAYCAPRIFPGKDPSFLPPSAVVFPLSTQVLYMVNVFNQLCLQLDESILRDSDYRCEADDIADTRKLSEIMRFGVGTINWVASMVKEIGPMAYQTMMMPLYGGVVSSRDIIDAIIRNMASHCYFNDDAHGMKMDTPVAADLSVNLFKLLSYINTQISKYGGSMQELMAMSLDGNYSK